MHHHSHHHKLCVVSFGVAIGLTWAIGVFIMGLAAMHLHLGDVLVTSLGTIYVGYKATLIGSLIGAGWAFLDGLIGGILIAFFYNLCSGCCKRACAKSCPETTETVRPTQPPV